MVTMIIVEDEALERSALRNCIDWELIGVEIVGEAANGAQGLSLVIELRPDIVLTDVSMPVMNAIEMSKNIRTIAPDTKILFISSYDDFEYAKQGISLNIFAYITKPVDESELLRIVKKAVDSVMEAAFEKKMYDKIRNDYNVSLKLARQAAVHQVLTGVPIDSGELEQLGLGWLVSQECCKFILLSVLENHSEKIHDDAISGLNRKLSSMASFVIHLKLSRELYVTIMAGQELPSKGELDKIRRILTEFFALSGVGVTRIEYAGSAQDTLAGLYDEIRQRSLMVSIPAPAVKVEKKKSRTQIVEEIEAIINERYPEALSIELIAKILHFTPNYIGTIYKLERGGSINRYLQSVRLENARRLLAETDASVNEIALDCGYENVTYFHTLFKKVTGQTPSEYRQACAKAAAGFVRGKNSAEDTETDAVRSEPFPGESES